MKKVLILVVSSQLDPYLKMWHTSSVTWDSIYVEGVETVFYFANPVRPNTYKEIYFPLEEKYETMGIKTLLAFEWALAERDFDYVCRVNASTYVDKEKLLAYIQTLNENGAANGLIVDKGDVHKFVWLWGVHYILSKDIVEKLVANKHKLDTTVMDDIAISKMLNELNVQFSNIRSCTIDRSNDKWRFLCYGSESFEFEDWADVKKLDNQFLFRCKQDMARYVDQFIMEELFKQLK